MSSNRQYFLKIAPKKGWKNGKDNSRAQEKKGVHWDEITGKNFQLAREMLKMLSR
jgi:hypothetical protein